MLLKVANRTNRAQSFLISVCRQYWYDKADYNKKLTLLQSLIQHGFVPRDYPLDSLKLEARKQTDGKYFWTLNKLSRAGDRWVLFVAVTVLTKGRR